MAEPSDTVEVYEAARDSVQALEEGAASPSGPSSGMVSPRATPRISEDFLRSGLAKQMAQRSGRQVDAFDAVLLSADKAEGRTVSIEVGDHGVSLRDPAGALLRVIPLVDITGWKSKAAEGTCVIVVSETLDEFSRVTIEMENGDDLVAALDRVAKERAEAEIQESQDKERRSSSRTSRARSSSYISKVVSILDPRQVAMKSEAA